LIDSSEFLFASWSIEHTKIYKFIGLHVFKTLSIIKYGISLLVEQNTKIILLSKRFHQKMRNSLPKTHNMGKFKIWSTLFNKILFEICSGRWKIATSCPIYRTNLIHDFTAVTFSVKLTSFREKRWFLWNLWFFVNFSAFSLIYDNSRVLSAAFVWMLLFATCRTSALSSWHWLSWVLTWCSKYSLFRNFFVCISTAPWNNVCGAREFPKLFPWNFTF